MARSTKADKARRLNAAHRLLEGDTELSEAAQDLSREFSLSLRQAYRYLEEAASQPAGPKSREATVPDYPEVTAGTVRLLRAYAKSDGLTLGAIVTRALRPS